MLVLISGVFLISLVLLDVFLTVLDTNGRSLFSRRIYRSLWWGFRQLARLVPPQGHHDMLSFAAPLMIPVMIGVWTIGLVFGFALVYFGGLQPDDYFTGGNSQPDLANALRLSFVTLSTIGFVEISPSNMAYSVTVALEAILGSIIITLTVTYYLGVQGVLSAFSRAGTLLSQRLDVTDEQSSRAVSLAIARDGTDLQTRLQEMQDLVVDLHEGLNRYPIVYFFRPKRKERGYPQTLRRIAQTCAALTWQVPASRAAGLEPLLSALRRSLLELAGDLRDEIVPVRRQTRVVPVSLESFAAARSGELYAPDAWVERFLTERADVRAGQQAQGGEGLKEDFSVYRQWLCFAVSMHDLEEAMLADLGYSERLRPGRSSSLVSIISRGPKDRPQPLEHVAGAGS
ncbi:hypothetical protein [Aurantimonas sp. VKM B-3413]|uniref:hypothetical protein n=1 Tax=Aurantimonas sp. VKM B-3413 TaxID=2779401 RepID=UPI001E3FEB2E|nr:hypothetical protein [Aurantimonas sp. VKM B-3413]MCB8840186.1 hypothetical protein [Aurantimonas sp. VKM B-3413]